MYRPRQVSLALPVVLFTWASVFSSMTIAQVTAPSVYTTTIQVQGEAAGMEFADWAASGITVVDSDPADNFGDLDIADIQVANDSDYIYIHATTHNTTTVSFLNLFLGFDTDQDTSTGWNTFDMGIVGSEIGYQNDFPFHQNAGAFNSGLVFTGGPIGNGGALIYPFWTEAGPPMGTEFEWAVPLEAMVQFPPGLGGPAPAFPNASFNFVVYTDEGLTDITQVISYTLAAAPNTPGDFDNDGDVDGTDFLIWQRGGSPSPLSPADLSAWQTNYGAGGDLTSATIAVVPEPGCLCLAALAVMAFAFPRKLG